MEFTVIDIETTGLSPYYHRVTEISQTISFLYMGFKKNRKNYEEEVIKLIYPLEHTHV